MRNRRTLVACCVAAVLLGAGGWWLLGRRSGGRVEETLAAQRRILAGEISGRDAKAAIDRMFRDVDKMSRSEIKQVRSALLGEWSRINYAAIEEYFAVDAGQRDALLERHIDRLVTAGELFNAANPYASGVPPRPRPPRSSSKTPTPEQKRLDAYRAAVVARAGKQRVTVPEWLLLIARR